MPRMRKEKDFSVPTVLRWLKIYYGEIPAQIDDGRLYEEPGRRMAKGLAYAIKAAEDSAEMFRKERLANDARKYDEARRRLG